MYTARRDSCGVKSKHILRVVAAGRGGGQPVVTEEQTKSCFREALSGRTDADFGEG